MYFMRYDTEMVVRTDAVARGSLILVLFLYFSYVPAHVTHGYSR